MNNKLLTIIIPTKDRFSFLNRLIEYIKIKGDLKYFYFIVLDSSNFNQTMVNSKVCFSNYIGYKKYKENITPFQKIKDGSKYITTPFVMLCADDDFYISENIKYILEDAKQTLNLKTNFNFLGETLSFEIINNKIIWFLCKSYKNPFYSIFTKEKFIESYNRTLSNATNITNELLITTNVSALVRYNKITNVRQVHNLQNSNKDNPNINKSILSTISKNLKYYFMNDRQQFDFYGIRNQYFIIEDLKKIIEKN